MPYKRMRSTNGTEGQTMWDELIERWWVPAFAVSTVATALAPHVGGPALLAVLALITWREA